MFLCKLFILPFLIFAKTPLAMNADADSRDFFQFIETHSEFIPLVDALVQGPPTESLERFLVKAQLEYLNGSSEEAANLFRQIAKRQHQEHWGRKDRSRINYAFFRLAQLTGDFEKWLGKAIAFDASLAPDEKLFTKDLQKAWQDLLALSKNKIIALPENAKFFEKVLVNGQDTPVTQGLIKVRPGLKKVSFFSNRYKAMNYTLRVEDLETLNMHLQELAQGNCQNPSPGPSLKKEAHIFYSQSCIRGHESFSSRTLVEMATKTPVSQPAAKSNFWKKNKTLMWVGATLIGAAVTVALTENQRRGGESSTNTPPNTATNSSASESPPEVIIMTNQ